MLPSDGKDKKKKNGRQKKWCSLHNSTNYSNQECFQQRSSSNCKDSDGRNSEEHDTYVVDSTAVGCKSCCCCNGKVAKKSNEESEVEYSPPPGIGFSFACCHPPLSHQTDDFQMLVDSGSSKHFVDPKLVHRVESRMQDYTQISPPMKIKAAGHNTLLGIAQGTLLVVVRDTQDICRTVKLPIVRVPGLGRNLFSTAMTAQKGVKTIITKAGSIVDLSLFSIQLTRSGNLDHLDLAISKESKRTESACCAISGKSFGKETVLTASVPQKYIALSSSTVRMNIDQRTLQDGSSVVGHDNDSLTYSILHNSTSQRSEVRFCEKNNPPSSTVVGIDEGNKSSDHLGNEDEIQNVETTRTKGLDNVGENNAVVVDVDSHIQRIVLATEETTVTQQVSHRPVKCQSRLWSQRGKKVNGSHHGDNPLLRPTGIQIATKSYAALQAMAPTNIKTVHQTSLLHIESNLDRLGMLSPTHDQRSQQKTGKITLKPVLINKSKFLKATHFVQK